MLNKVADIVRGLSADTVEQAGSGHPGMAIGCADIGAALYGEIMNYDPTQPNWPNRDRFILSAGHGSVWLYSFLHLSGYDVSLEDLKRFRQLHSKTPGHPEYGHTSGVETTTGPLGQGFANAVGMAISEKMLAERYNTKEYEIIDHYTYTLLGDGCMMEGVTSEAASLAGHLGLDKLIAIYDSNDISIGGNVDITFTESVPDRFKAYDWHVIDEVDGHDIASIKEAIAEAKEVTDKPTLIIANTHIAYGAPTKQDSNSAHGAPLGKEELTGLKENFGLPTDKEFYVSNEVREFFATRQEKLQKIRQDWEDRFTKWAKANPELKTQWDQAHNLELPNDLERVVADIELDTPLATRKASGSILRKIADQVPYLVGGSADLAPSNKTYLDKYEEIQKESFSGRNFRFGVREHAMGAIANGISLHGGVRPFTATFLVFSDYMRPAIRMAALMKQPSIYVFTHDSIYIGEDGPTHQPVEHVESLRLIPNLEVIRPADEEETKAAWLEAMKRQDGPTALILTRQNLPHLKKDKKINMDKGGYVVQEGNDPQVVLMASGSEVSLAVEVAEKLDVETRVVSIPDRNKFIAQGQDYIKEVLGEDTFRVALEAGVGQGWYQLLGDKHHLVSVEDFGASGSGEKVGKYFGFVAEEITEQIINRL
ncbi:transketolase [Halobacteroides halobius DSM 5150]|uniref:Transketolase n=1 Tax=Halobacteroides halobius (strain ATCC 35273 / DSM 5150 / MD-1) TaxID=748449 RepID=L0KDN7_HALHC|nr:transketolase [Halobacteroides halobius]AGB42198.1 transketolase [Halobacteroides halobius DSM 5150]